MNVALSVLFVDAVEYLVLGELAEGADRENLCLASREQTGTVNSRKHVDFRAERSDLVKRSAVDSLVLLEEVVSDNALFEFVDRLVDEGLRIRILFGEFGLNVGGESVDRVVANGLVNRENSLLHGLEADRLNVLVKVVRHRA